MTSHRKVSGLAGSFISHFHLTITLEGAACRIIGQTDLFYSTNSISPGRQVLSNHASVGL